MFSCEYIRIYEYMYGPVWAMVSTQWRPEDTYLSPSTLWVLGMNLKVISLKAIAFTKEPSGLLDLHVLLSGLVYLCCVSDIQGCQRCPASREGGRKGAGRNEESPEQSSQHILDSRLNITVVSISPLSLQSH